MTTPTVRKCVVAYYLGSGKELAIRVGSQLFIQHVHGGEFYDATRDDGVVWSDASPSELTDEERKWIEGTGNPRCSLCNGPHPFDTSIPSVVWNRVIRAAELPDYLCATCIVREFANRGESFTAELYGDGFKGTKIELLVNNKPSTDAAEVTEENNRLRHEAFTLAQQVAALTAKVGELEGGLSKERREHACAVNRHRHMADVANHRGMAIEAVRDELAEHGIECQFPDLEPDPEDSRQSFVEAVKALTARAEQAERERDEAIDRADRADRLYKLAIAEVHRVLDDARIPSADGQVCNDPDCQSKAGHRVRELVKANAKLTAELAAARAEGERLSIQPQPLRTCDHEWTNPDERRLIHCPKCGVTKLLQAEVQPNG